MTIDILVLGIYLKDAKLIYQRDACTPMFIAALFTIPKNRTSIGVYQQING